jgi:hypothetical protein
MTLPLPKLGLRVVLLQVFDDRVEMGATPDWIASRSVQLPPFEGSAVKHGPHRRLGRTKERPGHEDNQDPGAQRKKSGEDVGMRDAFHLVRLLRRWPRPALRLPPSFFREGEAGGLS